MVNYQAFVETVYLGVIRKKDLEVVYEFSVGPQTLNAIAPYFLWAYEDEDKYFVPSVFTMTALQNKPRFRQSQVTELKELESILTSMGEKVFVGHSLGTSLSNLSHEELLEGRKRAVDLKRLCDATKRILS